jgi:hypothetical protein
VRITNLNQILNIFASTRRNLITSLILFVFVLSAITPDTGDFARARTCGKYKSDFLGVNTTYTELACRNVVTLTPTRSRTVLEVAINIY